jgi:hypothetical protein
MDRKLMLESKLEFADGRVRLTFASDTRHHHAEYIIERQVKRNELQASFVVGESYQLEHILCE